jgi:nitrate/nitrite transporter NarK
MRCLKSMTGLLGKALQRIVYSRLKDEFGGRWVRVRGWAKVMTHLMFGILALTADQIQRWLATGPPQETPGTA